MISGVGSVAVLVNDAKKSAEWYHDKLGFEIIRIEGHPVFVKLKGSPGPMLHLGGRCSDWGNDQPGGRVGVWLQCGEITMHRDEKTGIITPASKPEDVERTYHELKKKGVEFSQELTTANWGKYAILRDLDGNEFERS